MIRRLRRYLGTLHVFYVLFEKHKSWNSQRGRKMASTCLKVTLIIIVAIVFLLGLFLLTVFPLAIYPSLVKSQLKLSTSEDGQPTTITWYWSHLPAVAYYNFYLFNVTNIDEAWFNGERISVQDVGPYAWK